MQYDMKENPKICYFQLNSVTGNIVIIDDNDDAVLLANNDAMAMQLVWFLICQRMNEWVLEWVVVEWRWWER